MKRVLVAGRNPASKRWPDHNPRLIEIRSGAYAARDVHPDAAEADRLAARAAQPDRYQRRTRRPQRA